MPRPSLAVRLAVPLLVALAASAVIADDSLGRARALLDGGDARAAVAALEQALPGASASDRPELLDALRAAYERAARQAEAEGESSEAEDYRDNLSIINRRAGARTTVEPSPSVPKNGPAESAARPNPEPVPARLGPPGRIAPASPQSAPKPDEPEDELAQADRAFHARRYGEAGRLYSSLAKARRLPEGRHDAWAYCRCKAVVDRLNVGPKDQAEWAALFAEIESIRRLSPRSWLVDYVHDLANERAPRSRRTSTRGMTYRGAAPDEPARPARPRAKSLAPPSVGPSKPPVAPKAEHRVGQAMAPRGEWQVLETANFTIFHKDAELAERAARVAEAARDEQTRKWTGAPPRGGWMPRCDLYLFPDGPSYREATKQPEESPGYSTFGLNGGRVFARELKLRADHPDLLKAVLPHEVTHAVLADLFADFPVPKWADEGMAVLAEPIDEQDRRVAPLADPLATGEVFRLSDLMTMGYPEARYWKLFYAQSVSLTRFLVDRGTPAQFIKFLRASQRGDVEAELRRSYQIEGYADLRSRWADHARSARPAETTAAAKAETGITRR